MPDILSREEVQRLIESASSPLHRVWLLVLYATGMRREGHFVLLLEGAPHAVFPAELSDAQQSRQHIVPADGRNWRFLSEGNENNQHRPDGTYYLGEP